MPSVTLFAKVLLETKQKLRKGGGMSNMEYVYIMMYLITLIVLIITIKK